MFTVLQLLAPHEQSGFGTTSSQRIQRRLMRAFVEKLGQRFFLGTAHVDGFAVNNLGDVR